MAGVHTNVTKLAAGAHDPAFGGITKRGPRNKGRRGNAIIEMVLMAPWLFFLFVGVLDFGYYSYALISVENAARVAALATSIGPDTAGNQAMACGAVFQELSTMPNITNSQISCNATAVDSECRGGGADKRARRRAVHGRLQRRLEGNGKVSDLADDSDSRPAGNELRGRSTVTMRVKGS